MNVQDIIKRIDNIPTEEWVNTSFRAKDIYYLIRRAEEADKYEEWLKAIFNVTDENRETWEQLAAGVLQIK